MIDERTLGNGDVRATVTYDHQGQLRPYADSEWRAEIHIEVRRAGTWEPVDWPEERGFPEDGSSNTPTVSRPPP